MEMTGLCNKWVRKGNEYGGNGVEQATVHQSYGPGVKRMQMTPLELPMYNTIRVPVGYRKMTHQLVVYKTTYRLPVYTWYTSTRASGAHKLCMG